MDQSHFESGDLVALPRTPNKGLGYVLSVPEPGIIQVEFPFDDIEFVHLKSSTTRSSRSGQSRGVASETSNLWEVSYASVLPWPPPLRPWGCKSA
jgi:hypothetical protein